VGVGTFGSRSMALGGGALTVSAEAVKRKALQVAASLLETSAEDLVYSQGGVQVVGAPERRLGLADLARAAEQGVGLSDGESDLTDENRFEPGSDAVPFGTTIAVVRIDRETGRVQLERLI